MIPDPATLDRMRDLGAVCVSTPAQVAQASDIIVLSLPKAAVVAAVMADMIPDLRAGAIILDTSTSEPATSQTLSAQGGTQGATEGADRAFFFVDGPVSGGPAAAHAGTMTMLLGRRCRCHCGVAAGSGYFDRKNRGGWRFGCGPRRQDRK